MISSALSARVCTRYYSPACCKEYGDRVKFVYKDFPLTELHPWAMHAAVDADCLAAQSDDAYWELADYLHANGKDISAAKSQEAQFAELDHLTTEQASKHHLDMPKVQVLRQGAK